MKKLKKILYEILILIVPVMLGVYLGLLANNWNKEKEDRKQTDKVLENILQEIDYNQMAIRESLTYFRQLRDSIHGLNDHNSLPSNFSFWKGLNPPLLKDASFQSASLSGVLGRLNIDLLEQLTIVYALHDELKE